jgi:HNH endonuclease
MDPEESAAVAYAVRRRGTAGIAGPPRVVRERRYSRAEVLDAVRRWAHKYGEAPTSVDWEPARARRMGHNWRAERFEDGRWPTVRVVRGHFGTFNDAVRLAGLQPRRAPARLRPNLAGPEAILEALVEWTRRYGDVPAMADWDPVRARRLGQTWRIARYREGDWPSARSVAHHFGSFAAAVTAAGLIPRPRSSTVESRVDARRRNRIAIALASAAIGEGGAAALAQAVRVVAASRAAGDPVALNAALIDVAAAAVAYADIAGADASRRTCDRDELKHVR